MTSTDIEQEQLILDSVGRFLDREVKPHVHALEHDDIYPADIVEGMKALGLFGATIGADYGGLGLSASTYAKIVEIVSTMWVDVVGRHLQLASDHGGGGRALRHAGAERELSAALRDRRIARRPGADRA
jgi:alkylation response protein AidB-like acyl-CoA dehydrogenase